MSVAYSSLNNELQFKRNIQINKLWITDCKSDIMYVVGLSKPTYKADK